MKYEIVRNKYMKEGNNVRKIAVGGAEDYISVKSRIRKSMVEGGMLTSDDDIRISSHVDDSVVYDDIRDMIAAGRFKVHTVVKSERASGSVYRLEDDTYIEIVRDMMQQSVFRRMIHDILLTHSIDIHDVHVHEYIHIIKPFIDCIYTLNTV